MISTSSFSISPMVTKSGATIGANNSGLKFFTDFITKYGDETFILECMQPVEITEDLMSIYANYLFMRATDSPEMSEDEESISRGTAINYLGHIKEFLVKKFPQIKENLEAIISRLKASLFVKVTNDCSKKGIVASEQSMPIGRELLRMFCEYFANLNTKAGLKNRSISIGNLPPLRIASILL